MTTSLAPLDARDDTGDRDAARGPGVFARAARNAWALTPFGGGVEAREPAPAVTVSASEHCTVQRYSPPTAAGTPVLLVPPLAVSIDCYDLRPGQSLVAHLVESGRPVYIVDYGRIRYADKGMGFEDWIFRIIPEAIAAVLEDCGRAGGAGGGAAIETAGGVDLVAWSLGGTLSLLTAAADPALPIRSITALGTPIDYTLNPSVAPLRLLGSFAPAALIHGAVGALGGIPSPLVQLSYRSTALQREITRPWFIARNLTDTAALAQMQAIDRFMAAMPGYPARFYTQMHSQLIMRNALHSGEIRFGDSTIDLADLSVPVLAIAGADDVIAPAGSVEAVADVLTGAPSVQVERVPGSHLGIVAGSRAAAESWPLVDAFHAGLAA